MKRHSRTIRETKFLTASEGDFQTLQIGNILRFPNGKRGGVDQMNNWNGRTTLRLRRISRRAYQERMHEDFYLGLKGFRVVGTTPLLNSVL